MTISDMKYAPAQDAWTVPIIECVSEEDQAAYQPFSSEQQWELAAWLQQSVERGLAAVEHLINKADTSNNDSSVEKGAHILAAVARTLREIAAMTQPQEITFDDEAGDDPMPRDIDDLRRELTRRVQQLVDGERNGAGETSDNV